VHPGQAIKPDKKMDPNRALSLSHATVRSLLTAISIDCDAGADCPPVRILWNEVAADPIIGTAGL
jgi:hypothetical protein